MTTSRSKSILDIPGYVFFPTTGGWTVRSPACRTYYVNRNLDTCTCPDFAARGKARYCKHIEGIREMAEREVYGEY